MAFQNANFGIWTGIGKSKYSSRYYKTVVTTKLNFYCHFFSPSYFFYFFCFSFRTCWSFRRSALSRHARASTCPIPFSFLPAPECLHLLPSLPWRMPTDEALRTTLSGQTHRAFSQDFSFLFVFFFSSAFFFYSFVNFYTAT